MKKHPDCEDRCQIREHKGYHDCTRIGVCQLIDQRALPQSEQNAVPQADDGSLGRAEKTTLGVGQSAGTAPDRAGGDGLSLPVRVETINEPLCEAGDFIGHTLLKDANGRVLVDCTDDDDAYVYAMCRALNVIASAPAQGEGLPPYPKTYDSVLGEDCVETEHCGATMLHTQGCKGEYVPTEDYDALRQAAQELSDGYEHIHAAYDSLVKEVAQSGGGREGK